MAGLCYRSMVLYPSTLSVKSADMNLKLALHAVFHLICDRNGHPGYHQLSWVDKQTLLRELKLKILYTC